MNTIRRGDIFYADLSPVVGSEQGGIRPVLIVQNDVGNRFSPTTIVAAITSRQDKTTLPTHVSISAVELPRDSVVLLEQIRTIDKRRLTGFVGSSGHDVNACRWTRPSQSASGFDIWRAVSWEMKKNVLGCIAAVPVPRT